MIMMIVEGILIGAESEITGIGKEKEKWIEIEMEEIGIAL
jgi:hypothetical protein